MHCGVALCPHLFDINSIALCRMFCRYLRINALGPGHINVPREVPIDKDAPEQRFILVLS